MNYLSITTTFCLLLLASWCSAQDYYSIESFQDEYDELVDYNSIALEEEGYFYWKKEFNFGFEFPFYDTIYQHINCDHNSTCRFDGSEDYNLYLFSAIYKFDNVTNPNNISSDVRYAYVEKNGVEALVIQFTKVRFDSDTTVEEYNSFLNFQTWLFENGNIEMRFGESNLNNCPNYVPGEGFYTLVNDTAYLIGPAIGMLHYSEPEQTGIGMFGTYDDFYVEYDGTGYIKTMPPEGWVIRFKKKDMTAAQSNLAETIKVYPNPAKDYFQLNSQLPIQRIDIISQGGKILKSYSAVGSQEKIPVNELLPGLKYLRLYTQNGVIHKILIIAK